MNANEKRFDDIEMLDIPDDEDSMISSSETEGIAGDLKADSGSEEFAYASFDRNIFESHKNYIELNDWLNSSNHLEIAFDPTQYKTSLGSKDEYANSYINYVNSLYKVIEGLQKNGITRVELEKPQEEQIGFISEKISPELRQQKYNHKINESFQLVISHLQGFVDELGDLIDSNPGLDHALIILECLQANVFYPLVNQRPELLVKWVNTFDPKMSNDFVEAIMLQTPTPYLHLQFWNVLLSQLLLRGLFDQANEVLESSSYQETTDQVLLEIISDLQQLVANYTGLSLKGNFKDWKLKACEFRDLLTGRKNVQPEHATIFRQIVDLSRILTGMTNTISEYCSSWYDLLVAFSLYQVRDDEASYTTYFQKAIQLKPVLDLNDEDLMAMTVRCFKYVLEESFLHVLKILHGFDPATAATVSKLLELKGCLRTYYKHEPNTLQEVIERKSISEYFLVKHAYECLNIYDLASVGVGLLLNTDISTSQLTSLHNKETLAKILPRLEYKTNDDLEWALTVCANLDLIKTARELYYTHGLKSLDEGMLFEALNMFANSYDPASLSSTDASSNDGFKKLHHIVWEYLFQDSLINNRPVEDDLINNIVDNQVDDSFEVHPVIRQCLSPYAVLFLVYKSLKLGHEKLAAMNKIVHLLKFNYLPKKYFPLLLSQVLPFLIDDDLKIELPDLIILIEFINNYESQKTMTEVNDGESLYKHAIDHIEAEAESYDWRIVLKNKGVKLPSDTKELIKSVRNEITSKIAQVYINL